MHGWMGKILHVDLSNSKITEFSTQPYAAQYLGGRGIASRLYWEAVTPEVSAFDPQNRLVFMTGPLVATGVQGATRMAITGKSPMTYPEGYCYGNIGGFFPAELKRAGYDGIVVDGEAQKPVYLWIQDDRIELCEASSLWGQGACRTEELLRQRHGNRVYHMTTGAAGERKVRTAVITGSHQSSSTGGFGAVMGAKKLKAIAVIGTGKPSVADPEGLKELNRYTVEISQRISLAIPPKVGGSGKAHLLEVVGKGGCYQCGLNCIRNRYVYGQRQELEANRKCQSMEYYLPWLYSREDEPTETFYDAPTLANDYSICTFELESIVEWLYACYQSGSLTEQETGLPLSRIGTREFLEKLLHSIAYREGFGDILAEGLVRAGEKVPAAARAMFSHAIAPIGQYELAPPRAHIVNALLLPMEPRVSQPITHQGFTSVAWSEHQLQPELSPVTTKVVRDVAKAFWGSGVAADESTYEGKALAAIKIQNRTYLKDCLGLCDFAWPITYSLNTPEHLGDPDLEAKIFSAVTGIDGKELERYAEVVCNLQRAIMVREGRKLPEADYPLDFNFTEPLKSERPVMAPGPGEELVNMVGNTIDRKKYAGMLQEYYRLRGWDEATGLPRAETLTALGLDDLASGFPRRG